jgi:DNA-binding transcriptional LysR family regulator
MDNISRITIFLSVAKHHSFTKAGKELGMTGSAISKQIQKLEDNLGVTLLLRTTRNVTLTEEGAIYQERARRAMSDLQEAENFITERKDTPTGLLKVSIPMSFGLLYLTNPIAEFARKYPDVKLEIDFDDRKVDILAEGYDIVIRIGSLADSSFISRKIAPCPVFICASPEYLELHGEPTDIDQLKSHKTLIFTKHSQSTTWTYKHKNKNGSVELSSCLKANNGQMLLASCLKSIGICALPIFMLSKHIKSGELVKILPEYEIFSGGGIYAVFPQNRHLSSRVRLFLEMLTEARKTLPW